MATSNGNAAASRADYGRVVAKALADEAFKARLLSDPHAALTEAGVEVPPGKTVYVVENTDDMVHLVLPPAPPEGELSEETIDRVVGGYCLPDTF